jgi:hypothetical protein
MNAPEIQNRDLMRIRNPRRDRQRGPRVVRTPGSVPDFDGLAVSQTAPAFHQSMSEGTRIVWAAGHEHFANSESSNP